MKLLLCTALLAFTLPAAAMASFDRHFGEYTVISYPANNQGCPLQDAYIYRRLYDGYEGIVLDAFGSRKNEDGSECTANARIGLSLQGVPGVTCVENDNHIHCTNGTDHFDATVVNQSNGELALTIVETGKDPGTYHWVLRHK